MESVFVNGLRVSTGIDESPASPREDTNLSAICIRPHRRYSFPNELGVNFDDLEDTDIYDTDSKETVSDHEKKKLDGYHVFPLDCYEHSGITFSLSGKGNLCRFDSSSDVGFIAVPRAYNSYTLVEWERDTECEEGYKVEVTEDEARAIAQAELETYNAYLNGEVYGYRIHRPIPTFYADGTPACVEYEYVDSCFGYYDKDEALAAGNMVAMVITQQ